MKFKGSREVFNVQIEVPDDAFEITFCTLIQGAPFLEQFADLQVLKFTTAAVFTRAYFWGQRPNMWCLFPYLSDVIRPPFWIELLEPPGLNWVCFLG